MKEVLFKGIEESLLSDLSKAKTEIKIAVAWFTNHRIYDLICSKIKEGLSVTTIIIYDPINIREGGLDWQEYINIGGNLYLSKYPRIMHHKFCLIDSRILYNGSYNWTYYAETINIENAIRFKNEHKLIQEFNKEFDRIIAKTNRNTKVKKFSLEDLADWFSSKPNSYCISKDIEYGLKASKIKHPNIAIKSINAATELRSNINTTSLINLRSKIERKQKRKQDKELVKKILAPQITKINKKLDRSKIKSTAENKLVITTPSIKIGNLLIKSKEESEKFKQLIDSIDKKGFEGEFGELRVNLIWNTKDDIDLHVIDPCRNHIHYNEMKHKCKGSVGILDFDVNADSPLTEKAQENIFWEEMPPIGTYSIFVKHYNVNQNEEVLFIVSIVSRKGVSKILLGKVHKSDMETIEVASFKYQRKKGITKIKEILKKSSM